MSSPLRFGVVGSGWRAEFFVRMARLLPDRFTVTGVVARSAERGAEVERIWGVPTVRTVGDLLAESARPELVVVAVPRTATPDVIRELVAARLPVLAETPPASDVDAMRALWSEVGSSGLVQVAEHSPFLPAHAARIAAVERGVVGQPTSVHFSSNHLYHAVAMIRRLLGAGLGEATVHASTFTAPLLDPVARDGWTGATEAVPASTILATLDFGDGRSGLYDFTDNQWHNPLRTNRIIVRGSTGELVGDRFTRFTGPRTIVESELVRRQLGIEQNFDGFDLEHISLDGEVLYRNAFAGARLADEDLAVAGLLAATAAWVHDDGPPPYPLAEGSQDHLLGIAIEEAAASGETVHIAREAWGM
jgi:predicted dehydrogenase